jgi:hypothetical protein
MHVGYEPSEVYPRGILVKGFLRREFIQHEFLNSWGLQRQKCRFGSLFDFVCIKTGGLPRGSPPTLIPPLRVVCLESPPSQGIPNFGGPTKARLRNESGHHNRNQRARVPCSPCTPCKHCTPCIPCTPCKACNPCNPRSSHCQYAGVDAATIPVTVRCQSLDFLRS